MLSSMKILLRTTALAAAVLIGLSACASPSGELIGTWGDPEAQATPSLEFSGTEGSGDYSGTDGCNSVGGSFTVEDGSIDLGLMRSTLMFCEGVDTWLVQARTAELSGDTLTLFDESGAEIGALERHAG